MRMESDTSEREREKREREEREKGRETRTKSAIDKKRCMKKNKGSTEKMSTWPDFMKRFKR